MSRKAVFLILGAGASKGISDRACLVDQSWAFPLTTELFRVHDKPNFAEILGRWRGAQHLAHELSERSDEGLEELIAKYAEHPNIKIRQRFLEVPMYIANLLLLCEYRYTSSPGSHIRLLQRLCLEHDHELIVLSLNYDRTFEQAVADTFGGVGYYSAVDDFALSDARVPVIKPHGSLGWYYDWSPKEWDAAYRGGSSFISKPENLKIIKNDDVLEAWGDERNQEVPYPAILPPVVSHTNPRFICPPSHLEVLKKWRGINAKCLVIGYSCKDAAILQWLIRNEIRFKHGMVVCGGEREATDSANRLHRVGFLAEAVPAKHAYTYYLTNDDFDRFLHW